MAQNIRVVLLKDWDPLIVGDNPHLADEYDEYMLGIIQLLERNRSPEQLEKHLAWIERDDMGLPHLSQGIPKAASKLVSYWNSK